jgi:hypothetical protein
MKMGTTVSTPIVIPGHRHRNPGRRRRSPTMNGKGLDDSGSLCDRGEGPLSAQDCQATDEIWKEFVLDRHEM